jgi:tetratricopeptide (TPR) repeat protein
MNIIKHTRDNDWNLLYSTNCHTKDIAWCALFCVPDNKGSPLNEQIKSDNLSALALTSCVDAIVRWAEELMASYHLLQDGGKLTICAYTKESNVAFQEKELTKIDHIAQLMSSYEDTRDVKPSSSEEVAKSLLAKEDAWTTKDNSSWLFKDDLSKEPSFIGSLPKGRRRKIIGNPQEEANYTSPLANLLNIEISDLRTTISLGRSLLGLAQFSHQFILEFFDKNLIESSSEISRLQLIQCSCLMNAIEVLSCSATILGHILSLDKLDEDDLDESVTTKFGPNSLLQLFAVKREESLPLLSVAGILSANSWFSFGKLVDKTCKVGANDHLMLLCFERALLILNSPTSNALNSRAAEFSSLLSPLTKYKCFLQSNATHSIGVYYYEQGDFDHAAEHLDNSSRLRRQMLDDHCKNCENADRGSLSKLKRNYLVSSTSISEEVFENVFKQSLAHARGYLSKGVFEVHELELNLSLTLEYLALNQHARQKYQNAISLFQESLILRTVHVGKNSLDVASLHFNMGVVYDDLEHYDSAISQYHESLRIRLNERNKATSLVVMPDLEESVLLT